jgi:hypothetical protein
MKLIIDCKEEVGNKIASFITDNNLDATIVIDDRCLGIKQNDRCNHKWISIVQLNKDVKHKCYYCGKFKI